LFLDTRFLDRSGDGRRVCGFLGLSGSLDAEFEFGLGSTVELLVDSRILAVQEDIVGKAVGVAFKDQGVGGCNCQEIADLADDSTVSKRQ
jgi:hypothetical protein